jgi:hypothetical protein
MRLDDQDRAWCGSDYTFRYAAEKGALDTGITVRCDDEKVVARRARALGDFGHRIPDRHK